MRNLDDLGGTAVDLANSLAIRLRVSLEVVIQVGEIDQREVWLFLLQDSAGRFGDPLRAGQAGLRAPKRKEWKFTKFFL